MTVLRALLADVGGAGGPGRSLVAGARSTTEPVVAGNLCANDHAAQTKAGEGTGPGAGSGRDPGGVTLVARALLAAAAAVVLAASPAVASPEDVANDISAHVMSPFCDGVTLHECPSAEALELRARIQRWAASGATREEILTRLERAYGPAILAVPPAGGAGWLAWIPPAAVGLAGAAGVWVTVRHWSRKNAAPPAQISPSERGRLDAELAALKSQSSSEPGTW